MFEALLCWHRECIKCCTVAILCQVIRSLEHHSVGVGNGLSVVVLLYRVRLLGV